MSYMGAVNLIQVICLIISHLLLMHPQCKSEQPLQSIDRALSRFSFIAFWTKARSPNCTALTNSSMESLLIPSQTVIHYSSGEVISKHLTAMNSIIRFPIDNWCSRSIKLFVSILNPSTSYRRCISCHIINITCPFLPICIILSFQLMMLFATCHS